MKLGSGKAALELNRAEAVCLMRDLMEMLLFNKSGVPSLGLHGPDIPAHHLSVYINKQAKKEPGISQLEEKAPTLGLWGNDPRER
jgi:hypothetical protein